jgi:ferric-dicitrate binding protein FerR (iron transport regulator)
MQDNRLWFLIARQLSGEISKAEFEELQSLLQENSDKQYLVDTLYSYFDLHTVSENEKEDSAVSVEEKFRRIIAEENNEQLPFSSGIHKIKGRNFKKLWRYAAAIAFLISVSGAGFYYFNRQKMPLENKIAKSNEVISKAGAKTKLVLPDGTQVWLNSGSKLNYSNDFNKQLREVELEGEAFFDVTKDAKHPFIVHASSINIKVVGTAFDVKSYPQDETIETTLLRGIIEVSRNDNPNTPKVILKPNEKLVFDKHLSITNSFPSLAKTDIVQRAPDISVFSISKKIPDSDKVETSWMYNKLVFDGDNFKQLAEKMERWYNVKITFSTNELYQYRFKGIFSNESIEEAFKELQMTAKFNYKINDNEIELNKK